MEKNTDGTKPQKKVIVQFLTRKMCKKSLIKKKV